MPQNPDVDNNPKRAASAGGVQPSAARSSIGVESNARLRNSRMVKSRSRPQYIVAPRRFHGFAPLAVSPLAFDAVEQALRSSPDIEVVDTLGPKGVVGTLADGLSGSPNVIVARMEPEKADMLAQQGQGLLIVESDQPLTLLDKPFPQPPVVVGSVAGAPTLPVQVTVLGQNEKPVPDAEVYLYGSLLPTMGVTDASGQVTLTLRGDTPDSIRAIYVKPKADYWSFYQAQPLIDVAPQPNVVFLRSLSDSFPQFPNQQMLGWGQKAMRLDQISPEFRGQGIKIAIVDSGAAATTHDDLRAITRGFNVVEKNTNPNAWNVDIISHGSHCAGVIAGSLDNGRGIRGFAPAAEIHVCKVFPGGQISQLIDALEYCIERQVDVVNLSVGTDQISEILEQQLARVKSLGIACISAAGNSGGPVQYPASSPNVLAVAAIGRIGEFPQDSYHAQTVQAFGPDGYFSAKFTCFGPEIGLCAPGVAVVSSVPLNNYAVWDGTSMAAPHVTGLAALVLAHHPDFRGAFRMRNANRVDRLFQILKASARPIELGDRRRTGFGMPDAPVALGVQQPAGVPLHTPSPVAPGPVTPGMQPAQLVPQGFLPFSPGDVGRLGGAVGPLSAPFGGLGVVGQSPYGQPWIMGNVPALAPMGTGVFLPLTPQSGYWGWWNR